MRSTTASALALALTLAASPLAFAQGHATRSTATGAGNPGFDTQETVDGRTVNEPNGDLNRWANDWSAKHQGRISHDAYMNEMNRRWHAMDREGKGLTPREVSEMTGHVDSNAAPALSGSGVQPGNMGPGNSRGK